MANLRPIPRRRSFNYSTPVSGSGSGSIIPRLFKPQPPAYREPPYVPVSNPELYFADLERNGTDATRLRELQAEYDSKHIEPEVDTKPRFFGPKFIDHIPVTITVKDNEKVKVKICHELATLHEKYYSKGKMPKIEERIKALKSVGYPDEVLLNVLKDHEKRIKEKPILDQFINSIFGEFSDKRAAAPKKKNLYQVLKIKKPSYATVDKEDDEEDAISDNEVLDDPAI